MRVAVVFNAKSGSALSKAEIGEKFKAANITVVKFIDITDTHSSMYIKKAIKDKLIITAIGGDGTISSVASHLVSTSAVFAPLPGGTLNHFTKDLGIPQDIDEAIQNIKKQKPTTIDVATVNGTIFVNNSSIGLYPGLLRYRDELQKNRVSKWTSMLIGAIRSFVRFRTYTVTIDGKPYTTPIIFVGNNDYHLRDSFFGNRTTLESGKLCLYIVRAKSRAEIVGALSRRYFLSSSAESFLITTRRQSVRVSYDGEHSKITTPLHYKILPKSLNVIAGEKYGV